jgi:hypothetical protein
MKKRTESKRGRARTWLTMLTCALVLTAGFFFAARQHFSSMDFGMKNSRLRKQVDDLESEKRRLMLAREVSLSPAEIRRAAARAKIGDVVPAAQAELASLTTKDKAVPPTAAASMVSPLITKTVAVASTAAKAITASFQKPAPKASTIDKKLVARTTATE